jgi:hypothetical protein
MSLFRQVTAGRFWIEKHYRGRAVWIGKIDAAPKDKTTAAEYFIDAELEQFLNAAIEECHASRCSLAERAQRDSV